jgi:ribonuclease HII
MALRASHRKNVVVRRGKRIRLPDVPHLKMERQLWDGGARFVVGMDEVGAGSWAGPLTVGAVVLDPNRRVYKVRDSKMLDPARREELAPRIQESCVAFGVGHAEVAEIDAKGMSEARRIAARRALLALGLTPEACLIDGHWNWSTIDKERTRTVVNGDAISLSIACASIVAKVTRDALMVGLSDQFPNYEWASNKGYPSPQHKAALAADGPSPLHRHLFAPIAALAQPSLFDAEEVPWASPSSSA